jgi:hypothetical protein
MKVENLTPFPWLVFESHAVDDTAFDTLVLRITLDLGDRRVLELSEEQDPLSMKDEFFGEPGKSSVRLESDLAPGKAYGDVIVVGSARAPGGAPAPSWPVSVRVGELEKRLRVTGPRAWVRADGRWKLTDPEPCAEVPMRYELAFGGVARKGDREETYEQNPLGVGFERDWSLEGKDRVEAPRIEAEDEPVAEILKEHAPEGVGVYGRAWLPRRTLAGTYDDDWLQHRWPKLPPDLHFGYWNGAHPGLVAKKKLVGDEEIVLRGFHPEGERRYRLPGYMPFVLMCPPRGAPKAFALHLDTLVLDLDRGKAWMTWRAALGRPKYPRVQIWLRPAMPPKADEKTAAPANGAGAAHDGPQAAGKA